MSRRLSLNAIFPYALVVLFPLIILGPVLLSGRVLLPATILRDLAPWHIPGSPIVPWQPFMFDGIAQFYPWRLFASVTERAGYLPLWNPYQFCGTPFLANSQSAVLYPPNIIFRIMPVADAFGASAWFHMAATGVFQYIFLRRSIGVNRLSALLGAATWQLSLWQITWLALPTFLCVSTWLPLALLLVDKTLQTRDSRSACALGLALGLMVLAGHPQISLYCFLLIIAYAIFRIRELFGVSINLFDTLRLAFVTITTGGLIGIAQLLPSVELSRLSHRAVHGAITGADYQRYISTAVPLRHLILLFIPWFYGSPADGTYWSHPDYPENVSYVGLVTLILASAAVITLWRKSPAVRFFAIAGITCLVIAFGSPLNGILFFGIPGFASTAAPGRILVLWTLCASALAALGLNETMRHAPKDLWRLLTKSAIPSIIVCSAALIYAIIWTNSIAPQGFLEARLGEQSPIWPVPAAIALSFAAAAWFAYRGSLPARSLGAVFLLMTLLDLAAVDIGYNAGAKPTDAYPITPLISYLKLHARHERIMPLNSTWSLDPTHPPHAILPPNTGMVYGLFDTQGYDSLFPGQYLEFAKEVNADGKNPAPQENGNIVFVHGTTSDAALALAVRYIIVNGTPSLVPSNMHELLVDNGATLYENTAARPRFDPAWLAPRVDGSQGLQNTSRSPSRVTLSFSSPATPSKLIVRDQYFPGWRADVSGRPVKIEQTPYIFRSVLIPAGGQANSRSTLSMKYEPTSILVGIYCLCTGIAFTCALFACKLPRRRVGY